MKHLARASLVLAMVVVGGVFGRTAFVELFPSAKADNAMHWAARTVHNQASADCADCHRPVNNTWQGFAHLVVACEDCHGPTRDHMIAAEKGDPAPLPLADARDLCLTCHGKVPGRPPAFPRVDPVSHVEALGGAAAACVTCHDPHNPGQPPEIPHTLEGRASCLACHGADKWKPAPPDHAKRTEDLCLNCHQPGPAK